MALLDVTPSYSSTLLIEELDAASGSTTQSVTLSGAGLPYMGTEWGGKLNAKTKWYPGNGDEATQQVLGPQEVPKKWQGDWRRTLLGTNTDSTGVVFVDDTGANNILIDPLDIVNALEGIFRGGQRQRVTWSQLSSSGNHSQTGTIIREGRATEWNFKVTRVTDIEWEVTWEWVSRGGNPPPKVSGVRPPTVPANSAAYLAALQALILANELASLQKFNPTSFSLGQLEQLAALPSAIATSISRQVLQLSDTISQVVGIATTLADQPQAIANAAADTAEDCVAQINNLFGQMTAVPAEQQTTQDDAVSMGKAVEQFGVQADAARNLATAGKTFSLQLRQAVQATALTGAIAPTRVSDRNSLEQVYICKEGDTPARVSMRFYKTPDLAIAILRANRLPWHTASFDKGKILVIPVVRAQAAGTGV